VDEHFCPQCSRILALGRHGDYFTFFGLPRKLSIAQDDLERRFRELSRKFHPDYYYNASPTERLASLERSSYLNDAYRALRSPATRIEHLLAIEGLPSSKSDEGTARVPPALLEEVFALNEELDEIRDARESGADPSVLAARLAAARQRRSQARRARARPGRGERALGPRRVGWCPERRASSGAAMPLLEPTTSSTCSPRLSEAAAHG
jgi:Fe-S protein assembly co-chaperone HscB